MAGASSSGLPAHMELRGLAQKLRRARKDRFQGRTSASQQEYQPVANPFNSEEGRLGETCASFCRPLPQLQCCFMDLNRLSQLLLLLEFLYGVLLIVLHTLLLMPPFNLPKADAFPALSKWLPMLDVQFGYRIEGGNTHVWEEDFIDTKDQVKIEESNYLGTVMGLVAGIITVIFCFAVVVRRACCKNRGSRHRALEKSWIVFSSGLVAWFCLCNLAKVPTRMLCFDDDDKVKTEVIKDANTIFRRPADAMKVVEEAAGEAADTDMHSTPCDAYRIFFTQWTLLVTLMVALLLWAAVSAVNQSIIVQEKFAEQDADDVGEDEERGPK